jgi:hypothetical protein
MRKVTGTVAVLVGILVLSGCGTSDPLPTLPPTPSSTPVFASEEEALAAAEDAYAAYSEVADAVANSGGSEPERLAPFVTEEQLQNELESAAFYQENEIHSVGSPTVISFELQQYFEAADGAEVVAYVCLDVSRVSVLDADGHDVTPLDRHAVVPLEVAFVADRTDRVLISSSELWSGDSFC